MAFPTGWARKSIVTIPDAQISGSNTNVPILITEDNLPTEMMDGGANSALNGGGDVRVSEDATGAVQIPLEIVSFITGGTPSVEMWVKLPSLNTGADKTFYVWYNKAAEVQPLVTDPFGRNSVWLDYDRVFHLKESANTTSGGYVDSSGNGDGTGVSMTLNGIGPFGGNSAEGDGAADRIDTGYFPSGTTFRGMSSWMYFDDTTTAQIFGPHDGSNRRAYIGINALNRLFVGLGNSFSNTVASGLAANNWYLFSLTYDGSVGRLYVDGVEVLTLTAGFSGISSLELTILLRDHSSAKEYLNGQQSEVLIPKNLLSADWIKTEYNNQSNPTAFAAAGTPEDGGADTLSIQKISHNISSDALILVQMHNLNVAPSNHNITSSSADLTLGQTVTPDYGEHISASDDVILFQNQRLVISGNRQAVSSDDVIFLQFQTMIMQNSIHLLSADTAPLFDTANFVPSPRRMQEARRGSRSFSNNGERRTIEAINHSTKRI